MYCKHCGKEIDDDVIICVHCGKQVQELKMEKSEQPIVINNNNSASSFATATAVNVVGGRAKNKWISFFLCLFTICGHKFYEGKIIMGIIYLCTGGLFFIGWFLDLIAILGKPNPYYV